MIAGFIILGNEPRTLIARAIGPSLPLSAALANPQLAIYNAQGQMLAENDDWKESPNAQAILETTIPPRDDREAAILRVFEPGAYTVVMSGARPGLTGTGLIELYDLLP